MEKFLISKLDIISKEVDDINVVNKEQNLKYSQLDKLRNDILHEIELNNISGSAMLIKYKELKAILRLRRKYKNNLAMLACFKTRINVSTGNAKKAILNKRAELEKRHYKRRIEESVRQELLNEIEDIIIPGE